MAAPDHSVINKKILGALLEKAELQGYLTSEDLLEVDGGDTLDVDQMSALTDTLRMSGIEVVEGGVDGAASMGSESDDSEDYPDLEYISIDDSVSLYLREMSRVPLLSVDEELDLARRMEKAQISRVELIKGNGRLVGKRRTDLEQLIQDGFIARDYLIKANTRLVVSIARKYIGHGVPFLDLIQEGNLGLIRAVEKYDYKRGFRFSTYATWWIRQSITRAIADQSRTIRVPVHMADRLRMLYKTSQEMEQELGRSPTVDELATQMEVTSGKVEWMMQVAQPTISLEMPVGDEDDSDFGMYVEDESSPSPAQIVYQNMLRDRVDQVLSTLSPREARILRLRFGLGHDRPYTLEEVGQKFGLTRERIRQIEGKALRHLRQPCVARLLREYTGS
jgi:RNA polymerase primary sigma factor